MLLALVPLLSMAQDDDMYFTTAKKKKNTAARQTYQPARSSGTNAGYDSSAYGDVYTDNSTVSYTQSARNDDEYNRRYAGIGDDVQQQQGGTTSDYDEEDLTNTDNNEVDYRYSRRLLRFHSPNVVVTVSSPYYWDLVYDCGVYDYLHD